MKIGFESQYLYYQQPIIIILTIDPPPPSPSPLTPRPWESCRDQPGSRCVSCGWGVVGRCRTAADTSSQRGFCKSYCNNYIILDNNKNKNDNNFNDLEHKWSKRYNHEEYYHQIDNYKNNKLLNEELIEALSDLRESVGKEKNWWYRAYSSSHRWIRREELVCSCSHSDEDG